MSAPKNPLTRAGEVTGDCSIVSARSVMESNPARESPRAQDALRVKCVFQFLHQGKIGARRSPYVAYQPLHFCRAPFQHRLRVRFRLAVELQHILGELRARAWSDFVSRRWRKRRVENAGSACERHQIEPATIRQF